MDNIIDYNSLPFFEEETEKSTENGAAEVTAGKEKEEQRSTFLLIKPATLEEAEDIIHYIETKQAALLDLSSADMRIKQRILDFVAGAACALNCNMERVSKESDQYLISPSDMMVVVQKSDR